MEPNSLTLLSIMADDLSVAVIALDIKLFMDFKQILFALDFIPFLLHPLQFLI